MTLPASGTITMAQVNTELGLSSSALITLNDTAVRTLFGKASGAISMSDGWGKSSKTPTVEYLVVGGGGNGGSAYGNAYGGGGGGGQVLTSTYSVSGGVAIVIVVGGSESNSTFGSITAQCGQRGYPGTVEWVYPNTYTRGGDGGTSGSGYVGSLGQYGYGGYGGYGGGAGGTGATGGAGITSSITGSSDVYGKGNPGSTYGGGGNGATYADPMSGTSGAVIICYPNTYPDPVSVTGSPTVTNTGGYKIYKWTSVGTWSITF